MNDQDKLNKLEYSMLFFGLAISLGGLYLTYLRYQHIKLLEKTNG